MALTLKQFSAKGVESETRIGRQRMPSMGDMMAAADGGFGRVIGTLGRLSGEAAQRAQEAFDNQRKADNANVIMGRVTAFEDTTRTKQNELLGLQGENARGVYDQAMQFANAQTETALNGVTDPELRIAIIDQLSSRRRSFLNNVGVHAERERLVTFNNTQKSRLAGLHQDFAATTTPEDEQSVTRNITLTVQSLGAAAGRTPEQIEQDTAGQISKAIGSKVIGLAVNDPKQALNYYQQHQELVLPTERAGLEDRLQGKIKQMDREQEQARRGKRAEIVGSTADAYAYMLETGDAGNMINLSTSLRKLGYNEDADNIDLQVQAGSMAYNLANSFPESQSFAERLQKIEQSFPVTGPEGAASIVKARNMAAQAVTKQAKAFVKDPAGYADGSIPAELTGEARITARLERQKELGQGINYRASVLSNQEKQVLTQRFQDAETARDKLAILSGIENEFEGYSPMIFKDMGIPSTAFVATDLVTNNPGATVDAELLVTASTTKSSDIPARSDLDTVTVKGAVQGSEVFEVYSNLAEMAGTDSTLQETVRSLQNTLSNVVLLTGDTDGAKVLDKYYGTMNTDNYVLTYDKSRIDDDALEKALDTKKELARTMVVGGEEKPDIFSRLFGNTYDNNTIWINSPNGDGWSLFSKNSQSIVTDMNGNPVTVSEAEVFSPASTYGKRADGTDKGFGYFGPLASTSGQVMTEFSIGVEINGKETEIPLIVPTLSRRELNSLLKGNAPTDAVVRKAEAYAKNRLAQGKSPFAQKGEQVARPGK